MLDVCHCLMFSVVIWLYVCLCHFDSVSYLVDVPVIICSNLGMLGNFEKPRVPVQKPVVSTTVPVGKWTQQ